MNKSKKIDSCRLCDSKKLLKTIDFGRVPLGNNLSISSESSMRVDTYKLCLFRCNKCNHFQLNYEVSPDKLYATNYTYLSGVAPSFIKHFDRYSKWIIKKCNLNSNNTVLDVGSNDGTCLNAFKNNNIKVLGIDPASLPSKIANKRGINTLNKFFNRQSTEEIKKNMDK